LIDLKITAGMLKMQALNGGVTNGGTKKESVEAEEE